MSLRLLPSRARLCAPPALRAHARAFSAPPIPLAEPAPGAFLSSSDAPAESSSGLVVAATQQRGPWPDDKPPDIGTPNVPAAPQSPLVAFPTPPFHTHEFFVGLRHVFAEPVARCLMKATRAILVHRNDKMDYEMLNRKDQDNQAYLFRAALSELQTEMSMRTRNEFATLQTTTSQIRREVDSLDGKMKEDVATLKNDLQMDIENRKHDSRAELKSFEMAIEDLANKAQIRMSDIRTGIEKAKWRNTRRGMVLIGFVVLSIIASNELEFRKKEQLKEETKRRVMLAQAQAHAHVDGSPHELE